MFVITRLNRTVFDCHQSDSFHNKLAFFCSSSDHKHNVYIRTIKKQYFLIQFDLRTKNLMLATLFFTFIIEDLINSENILDN
jgi:hypothetical protein